MCNLSAKTCTSIFSTTAWLILVAILLNATPGCQKQDLQLVIRWESIAGLRSGDRVLLDATAVGTVTDVYYTTDGDYRVAVSIQHAFANAATAHAQFHIIEDPANQGRKAIEINHLRAGGPLLKDGSVIDGAKSPAWSFDTLKDELNRVWDQVQQHLKELTEDLRRLPEDEAIRRLRDELQHLYRDLENAGQEARERFKAEVLPLLREEVERLREYLRQLGREQEMAPLETVVRDIEAL